MQNSIKDSRRIGDFISRSRTLISMAANLLFLSLLFLLSSVLTSCSLGGHLKFSGAKGGEADLSQGFNFDQGDMASLAGEWEFFDGVLLAPDKLPNQLQPTALVKVPGPWAENGGFPGQGDKKVIGAATLRLKLKIPSRDREWAIRLPNASSAVKLFVDGLAVAEVGQVSDDPLRYRPSNGLALPVFRASGGKLELVMQIQNYSVPRIGTWDSPILGEASTLLMKRQVDVTVSSLVSGALLIMGLYHLGLFFLRKKDLSSLLFGVICLLMTVRNFIMGERLYLAFFQESADFWVWAFKIEHLSAHMALPLFALFFRRLYPKYIAWPAVFAIIAVAGIWATLTMATPPMFYQRFLHWYEYFLVVSGLYLTAGVSLAAIRKEEDSLIVLLGILVLLGTSVNDVLLSTGVLAGSVYLASFGVFFYIFAQSFHLSMIFSKSFSAVEDLSQRLLQKNDELESLHKIDLAIASSMELDRVLSLILDQAMARLSMDAADVLLLDPDEKTLSLGARVGFRTDALLHTRLRKGEGFAGQALDSEGAIIAAELDADAASFSRSPAFEREGFFFYAGRRLEVKGEVKGVLELYRRSPFRPYSNWELYFETLAGQAAVALDNSFLLQGLKQANGDLREANEGIIEGWAAALDLRDRETEGHSRRVTDATMLLADRFGISGEELIRTRHGALLHDIGKLGIPDAILLKPGPLNPEEFAIMKRHPSIARELLSRFNFLSHALDIPYCHHEKWDGSGYPRGLAGEAIPLTARLFAVVDVWDALRSDRPYRESWPEDKVLAHIASLAGKHFDPEAANAFIHLRRGGD